MELAQRSLDVLTKFPSEVDVSRWAGRRNRPGIATAGGRHGLAPPSQCPRWAREVSPQGKGRGLVLATLPWSDPHGCYAPIKPWRGGPRTPRTHQRGIFGALRANQFGTTRFTQGRAAMLQISAPRRGIRLSSGPWFRATRPASRSPTPHLDWRAHSQGLLCQPHSSEQPTSKPPAARIQRATVTGPAYDRSRGRSRRRVGHHTTGCRAPGRLDSPSALPRRRGQAARPSPGPRLRVPSRASRGDRQTPARLGSSDECHRLETKGIATGTAFASNCLSGERLWRGQYAVPVWSGTLWIPFEVAGPRSSFRLCLSPRRTSKPTFNKTRP
jgi:hypothetical protein